MDHSLTPKQNKTEQNRTKQNKTEQNIIMGGFHMAAGRALIYTYFLRPPLTSPSISMMDTMLKFPGTHKSIEGAGGQGVCT